MLPQFEITPIQNQILLGSTFGDGNFKLNNKTGKEYYYFRELHAQGEYDYVNWKYHQLLSLTNQNGLKHIQREDREIKKGILSHPQPAFEFQTKTSPVFVKYLKQPKYKLIDEFEELALLIWILDDGWANQGAYCIASGVFNSEEIDYIREIILEKFNIETSHCVRNDIFISKRYNQLLQSWAFKYLGKDIDVIKKKFIIPLNKINKTA